jgi:hypothetical protein
VFWNQYVSGFPQILAQQCSNRHGFFLIIEEYEGRRSKGFVLVPKGKVGEGEGWKRFGEELHLLSTVFMLAILATRSICM